MLKKREDQPAASTIDPLLAEIRQLIEQTRASVATAVNAGLTMLNWRIGKRIGEEVLAGQRAEYGNRILAALSQELTAEFGPGFSYSALTRMIRFSEVFPDSEIVATLSQRLGWSHFQALIPLKDQLQRDFYAEMCRVERWSVRTLRKKIDTMLFERTGISRKPEELARRELAELREEDRMTTDLVFRDPYVLDFLRLKDTYSERDLEAAILRELERFLLELGAGFAFVARQKRIVIDDEDFYLDLLLFHRKLRRLVAVELKIGRFQAAHKGQMELYLRWLARHEVEPGEEPPLGLILCAGKSSERIELLELGASGIHVAEYLTALPPKALLEERLRSAIAAARAGLEGRLPPSKPAPVGGTEASDE
jgi:predicted nuclease of restriction endonuclease-like (RecB) superfamily